MKVLLGQGNPAGELVASVFFTSQILLERIAQFEEAEILPRRICGFNYPVFINRYKEIVADAAGLERKIERQPAEQIKAATAPAMRIRWLGSRIWNQLTATLYGRKARMSVS